MDNKLLDIFVCPLCNGRLTYLKPEKKHSIHTQAKEGSLVCKFDRLAFPIIDDTPVILHEKAIQLSLEQVENIYD